MSTPDLPTAGALASLKAAATSAAAAFNAATEALAAFHIAMLGPGYFRAEQFYDGRWCPFAGGPAWFVVGHSRGRSPVRYVRSGGGS